MDAPTVEHDGIHVRLRAVAFGTATVIDPAPGGTFVAYHEAWDAQSFEEPRLPLRLLVDHDRRTPTGWLEYLDVEPDGLWMTGRLVGGPEALASVRALAAERLRSQVSIGFHDNPKADEWSKPATPGALATVRRRGARIDEVSLVAAAGITGSHLASITVRPPGLSPASKAVLAAVLQPPRAVVAARNRQAIDAIRATTAAAPPAGPTQEQVLAEARDLVDAGRRWRTPVPALSSSGPTWEQRWDALLAREPDPRDWHARRSWEHEMAALLCEDHD